MNDIFELAARLSSLSAVSGREAGCFDELEKITDGIFDSTSSLPTGTFFGRIKCTKTDAPTLLFDAHIDEIGFVVTDICEGGFLRVAAVGGIDTMVLSATEVVVHGREDIRGVFTSKPPHLQEAGESEKKILLSDLYIDTGIDDGTLEEKVRIGDAAGFCTLPARLENDMMTGKSFDDRICAAAILKAAADIDRSALKCDLCVMLSGGEEIGYIGARTGAFAASPCAAVVLDVTNAYMPDGPRRKKDIQLGGGPVITYSATTSRPLTDALISTARGAGIRHTVAAEAGATGTNAQVIQITGNGIPTALISLPLRYMHTCAEVISLEDTKNAAALLKAFAESFEPDGRGGA